jgi:hypothetical protein
MIPNPANGDEVWWGQFDLAVGETFVRTIGPMNLRIERTPHEWRTLLARRDAGPEAVRRDEEEPERFAFGETKGPLSLTPVVADRAVVTRPLSPLHVSPNGSVTLYVSTPIWIRIEVDDPPVLLNDRYIVRPSDTWFGPSTREGDLCYDSRTAGRLALAEVPVRPERALTAATIHNLTERLLPLDRISLPAPQLAMYVDSSGMLWTGDITLVKSDDEELAQLTLGDGPPGLAPAAKLVSEPREAGETGGLFRAFGAIFQ